MIHSTTFLAHRGEGKGRREEGRGEGSYRCRYCTGRGDGVLLRGTERPLGLL